MKYSSELEQITKMSHELQNHTLRSFVRVDIKTKLKIFDLQRSKFHQLKSFHSIVNNNLLSLASLILAIDEVIKGIDDISLNAMKPLSVTDKKQSKHQLLLDRWAIIKTLKNKNNMSFRQISQYLRKYQKLEISYSMIHSLWIKLENNTGEKK